ALLPAMNQLIREGKRVTALFGSKTKNEVFCPESAISCILTEDGTLGEKGTVDEKVVQAVKDHAIKEILACGPEKMLERVLDMANDLRIRYQASVERVMKCCVGICGSCTVGDENVKTTCKDGPIFTGEELQEFPSFGKHE
ncbi:dihydroorotate dehydrogenase electron transfer subunit, partial [Candidatus Bathyarchaeota archaeon]|nr:dihydroorotate dehydrogenase electron transfer subunit [Candidatus Bathyarchaeota archaeon]